MIKNIVLVFISLSASSLAFSSSASAQSDISEYIESLQDTSPNIDIELLMEQDTQHFRENEIDIDTDSQSQFKRTTQYTVDSNVDFDNESGSSANYQYNNHVIRQ